MYRQIKNRIFYIDFCLTVIISKSIFTRMRCRCSCHILGVRSLLAAVIEPVQDVEHRLWILLLLLFADV